MYLKEIADHIGDGINDTTLKSTGTNYSRTKQFINEFYRLNFLPLREWEFLRREGSISQVAQYTTGTALFTNGSTTVIGTGTTWVSATHVNRYIFVDGERHYKVTAVASTTSLTIESAYEGDTGTKSYTIAQFRYKLPRWVDYPVRIYGISRTYETTTPYKIRQFMTRPSERMTAATSQPYVAGPRERTLYTTGTVSGTSGTKTLTGSSTAWLTSGIEQFDEIQIGSVSYTVDSVNSDTSITLFKNIISTIASATTYTAVMDRWTLDFNYYSSEANTLYITAAAIVPPLDDDYDIPFMPDNWHYLLVLGGKLKARQHNNEDVSVELSELSSVIRNLVSINSRSEDRLDRFIL
jgi:hypothetical protein